MLKLTDRVKPLKQSGIRAASQRCAALKGINLGQGICDIPIHPHIKEAAYQAIENNKSIYSACEGIGDLRAKVANKINQYNKIPVKQEEVLITHGATGAFQCAITTLLNAGDEVILFEPFYGYHKNLLALQGITIKAVEINLEDYSFSREALTQAIGPKTRAIVICTPCNPCGKVFTKDELLFIGELAQKHELITITDEIYEYITYPGHEHVSYASLKDFREHTVTISGFSKTYNMTGWRLGYASAPTHVIEKMALVQDLLYVCPSTPLQHAAISAFDLQQNYYDEMKDSYLAKRTLMVDGLNSLGFNITAPQGAYYFLADFSELGWNDDQAAMDDLLTHAKVATVTGRSFYDNPVKGQHRLRFCYALNQDLLEQSLEQIQHFLQQRK